MPSVSWVLRRDNVGDTFGSAEKLRDFLAEGLFPSGSFSELEGPDEGSRKPRNDGLLRGRLVEASVDGSAISSSGESKSNGLLLDSSVNLDVEACEVDSA